MSCLFAIYNLWPLPLDCVCVCYEHVGGWGFFWHMAVPVSDAWLGHGTGTKLLSFTCQSQAVTPDLPLTLLYLPPSFSVEFPVY